MHVNPYLNFEGQCEEAFRFYQQTLGGELVKMARYGESPVCDQVPAQWQDKIIHAQLMAGDLVLMGSDSTMENNRPVQGVAVALMVDDVARAEDIFSSFAENGEVRMALQETFWVERFGVVVDAYGVPWLINGGREQSG